MLDTSFVEELASSAPVPGGGGASAYVGALSSALASMVGNLTVGKKTYAQVEDEVTAHLAELGALRERLIDLVGADARAFEPLSAAYRMPKAMPEEAAAKEAAIQYALIEATEVPLEIMRAASGVVAHADYLAHFGSRLARSDAGVAAAFARAAVDGASLNVFINAASMDDEALASRYRAEAEALAAETREECDKLFDFVKTEVS